jgi:hypothetical protein
MRKMLRVSLLVCSLAQGACDADSSGPAASSTRLEVCDPLAPSSQPLALGKLLAVGESNGTLFVVAGASSADDVDRVFVSRDGVLERKRVLGSGSQGGSDADFTVSYEDGELPARLVVKRRAAVIVGMALVHDTGRSFFDQLGDDAERLRVGGAQDLAGLPLANLPGEVLLEVLASTPDGATLVLTRPRDDWSYGDERVFYGHDGVLDERTLVPGSVSRSSRIWFSFRVQGVDYDAQIASELFAPGVPSTLNTPDGQQMLQLLDVSQGLPEDATFRCFR